MKIILAATVAVAVLSPSPAFASDIPRFSKTPEFLIGAEALAVFKQCSRSAPAPTKLLERPSTAEVEQLERAVGQRVAVEFKKWPSMQLNAKIYMSQYVAYSNAGRRMIYGNYFPVEAAKLLEHSKGMAFVACDGGAQFWGVTFDPSAGTVESLSFNGSV